MGNVLNLTGQRYGRLTVLHRVENRITPSGKSISCWKCICDCGNETCAATQDLRSGDAKSCGCLKRELTQERMVKHGDSNTHLHNVWRAMLRRCSDKRQDDYCYYGGKGVSVCDEWRDDYIAFKEWSLQNGYSEELTIDRIDVDRDYSPDNCRWVSMKVQCNNRTSNRKYVVDGRELTIAEISEIYRIPYSRLYMRLRNGWPIDKAAGIKSLF